MNPLTRKLATLLVRPVYLLDNFQTNHHNATSRNT